MNIKLWALWLFLATASSGCGFLVAGAAGGIAAGAAVTQEKHNESQLTPLQMRVMQAKELNGTFDDAREATIAVLQDEGYEIKTSDYQGGIITGGVSKNTQMGREDFTATVTLEKFTENRIKVRISVQRQCYNALGWKLPSVCVAQNFWGCTKWDATGTVQEPEMFQDFYASVQQEMFRREQLNK